MVCHGETVYYFGLWQNRNGSDTMVNNEKISSIFKGWNALGRKEEGGRRKKKRDEEDDEDKG